MKIKSIYIKNYKVLNDFKIDFCNDSTINPVTVICGINGSGKTSLLEFINTVFTKQNINGNNKIIIEEKGLFTHNNLLPQNNQFTLTDDFFKNYKQDFIINIADKIIYYQAGIANKSAYKLITDYIDELIYEKDIRSSNAYEKLRNDLNEILESLNLGIEFSSLDKKKDIYFRNNISDKIRLQDLSGGEKEIITKLLPLYLSNVKDSVILIDEPESSLHPNWQNEIMSLYQKVAEQNNNQIIITTHSPHIVSAIKQKYLKILKKTDDYIKVIDSTTQSYGKKIDTILLDIFRIKGLRTPIIDEKIRKLTDLLNLDEHNTAEFNNLLTELENSIGKFDEDLATIRLEMKRKQLQSETNN